MAGIQALSMQRGKEKLIELTEELFAEHALKYGLVFPDRMDYLREIEAAIAGNANLRDILGIVAPGSRRPKGNVVIDEESVRRAISAHITSTMDRYASIGFKPPYRPATTGSASISNLELIQKTIGNLQAGGRLAKSISKRDAMNLSTTKRHKKGKKAPHFVCPGKAKCRSVLCSHSREQSFGGVTLEYMFDAIIKALEKENLIVSRRYVDEMLTNAKGLLLPAVNAIKADIAKREEALTSTGRLSLNLADRDYSYRAPLKRNLFAHFQISTTATRDQLIEIAESHNARILDFESKGEDSNLVKDLVKRYKNDNDTINGALILYEIEAQLMSERAACYKAAVAKGKKGDILEETMRNFDKGIASKEWIHLKLDKILSTGVHIMEDNVVTTEHGEEHNSDHFNSEMNLEEEYEEACKEIEQEMAEIILSSGYYVDENYHYDHLLQELIDADSHSLEPSKGLSTTKNRQDLAVMKLRKLQSKEAMEKERILKVCEDVDCQVREQYEWFQTWRLNREETKSEYTVGEDGLCHVDDAKPESLITGWEEYLRKNLLEAPREPKSSGLEVDVATSVDEISSTTSKGEQENGFHEASKKWAREF